LLIAFVDSALDRMIETGKVEPGLLSLIAGATATLAALDARANIPNRKNLSYDFRADDRRIRP
jgi:hypothetical protein